MWFIWSLVFCWGIFSFGGGGVIYYIYLFGILFLFKDGNSKKKNVLIINYIWFGIYWLKFDLLFVSLNNV